MKDVTSTTFGLVIAYLLPGLVGVHAASYFLPNLRGMIEKFLTFPSHFGLFLYMGLIALVVGLQLNVIRWVVYEVLAFRVCNGRFGWRLDPPVPNDLSGANRLVAFRAAVDETFRYHQFWGAFSIAFVPLAILTPRSESISACAWYGAVIVVELATVAAAFNAYMRYCRYGKAVLNATGGDDGERLGKGAQEESGEEEGGER